MFYTGVVENRYDPLRLGRCQVRVFGLHNEDKAQLPTDDLPWAVPIQPVTSAGVNGIGHTPLGPVEGSWVIIVFRDKDCQQPMMLGTVGGIPQSSAPGASTPAATPENVLTDSSGNVVTDGSGNPILTGTGSSATPAETPSTPEKTKPDTKGWSLGQSSERFESGGRGPGTINSYQNTGDFGGASYGTYQFASYLPPDMPNGKKRSGWETSAMRKYLQGSIFSAKFAGKTPGTADFDNAWKQVASQYPKEFSKDQHDYIQKNFYDVLYAKVMKAGIDISENGPAVQDCIWSTAVQYGANAVTKITRALPSGKTKFTDEEFVTLVQDSKAANASKDFSKSSAAIQQSIVTRAKQEKDVLLKLARSGAQSNVANVKPADKPSDAPVASTQDPAKFDINAENTKTLENGGKGFYDPNGKYPKQEFLNEPDTNRLARNMKIASTIVSSKESNALRSAKMAGGGSWSEPEIPFAGKYPFNHVYESESGHVMEFDDTPEAQRWQIYHRAGTYIEIDRNGRQVNHIVGDGFHIIERNGYVYVGGRCNITIDGPANVMVGGHADIEVSGNVTATVGNDLTAQVSGGASMSVAENFEVRAGGNIVFDAAGNVSVRADGNVAVQAEGNTSVKASGDAYLNADGDVHTKAGGTGYFSTGGNLELNAGGNANLDGSLVQLGMGAADAADPEAVEASELAMPGPAQQANEAELETLQSSYRGDEDSLFFETPEEANDKAAIEKHQKELIESGKASEADLSKPAITGDEDKTPSKAPNPSIKADCASIATMNTFPDNLLLSPNFTLGKLSSRAAATQVPVKEQYGLTKEEIVCNLQFLALNVLEPIRKLYPDVLVTSGFRDWGKSKTVSQHCLGEAVDLQFPKRSKSEYFDIAKALKDAIPYDQLLLEYKSYGTGNPWIHVSLKRTGGNRKQVLTMYNDKTHSQGLSKLA